jgi:oligopeptide/dipeptide ABC transporter ATP-binding protein
VRVENVYKFFSVGRNVPFLNRATQIRAVDGVSFEILPHETLGIVGESGCGKTTTSNLILRVERPTAGSVTFEGNSVHNLAGDRLRRYRRVVQAVFQDPWSSLNPRMRAQDIIAEPLRVNSVGMSRQKIADRVSELLADVGLDSAAKHSYPHEFSGGQRQRIAVARALASSPQLVVLDEPVSSLDVSVSAQLMNLLKDIQARLGIAYLLIAHNLATVRYLSRRVLVMYLGQVVESGTAEELFASPLHPYTKALISASLVTRPDAGQEDIVLSGEVVAATEAPHDCRFRSRCPFAFARCSVEVPELREVAQGHKVACHLY